MTGNWTFRIKSLFQQVQLKNSSNCTRALPLLFAVLFLIFLYFVCLFFLTPPSLTDIRVAAIC